jgi:beta-barrel assembly-enhancing protease
VLCLSTTALFHTSALAEDPKALVVNIPAEPLAQALEEFARQTDLQVVYVSDEIADQRTQGAEAPLEPKVALEHLLKGTGLRYEFLNSRTVHVIVAPIKPDDVLEEIIVTAQPSGGPYPPHFPPPTLSELRTLKTANEDLEHRIERSQLLYQNAALDQYLREIVVRLLAIDGSDANTVHIRVIKSAEANAFALSNGSIYLTTGLIAALSDEAELAGVLGHELTHYTNSHVVRGLREEQHKQFALQSAHVLLEIALAAVAAHNHVTMIPMAEQSIPPGPTLELWMRASVTGYPRDLEREADFGGVHRAVLAGFDSGGAIAALSRLAAQAPSHDPAQFPLYSSRSRIEERIADYREMLPGWVSRDAASQDARSALYHARLGDLRLDQVDLLLEAGSLDRADVMIAKEIAAKDSSRAEFLKGEIARNRIPQTDATVERALAAYERAVTLPDVPISAYRQAGLLHQMRGENAAAKMSYQSYLTLAPTAIDAPFVQIYLDQLRTTSATSTTQ